MPLSRGARAHATAADALEAGRALRPVYNLGSGTGLSVREVVELLLTVTGTDLRPVEGPRRPGDPARIVASGERAAADLDWHPAHSAHEMASSAYRAWGRRRSANASPTPTIPTSTTT